MTHDRLSILPLLALAAAAVFGAVWAGENPSGTGPWSRVPAQPDAETVPDGACCREAVPGEDDLFGPDHPPSPFLLGHTAVTVTVAGPVAHTVVRQDWTNPNRQPVDGLYIFPLPENAAVTGLRLRIGDRVIEGRMDRREQARDRYERARAEGRVAALLDQERPNVFAQQVANILPRMRIEVILEFDQEVRCDAGECAYVLPTVVGPRFVPAHQGDPGRILPPVLPAGADTGVTLSFEVTLDAGMPIRDARSILHAMQFETLPGGRIAGRLAAGGPAGAVARLDRDIEVRWRLGGRDPEFGVLAWRDPGRGSGPGVFTLFAVPPVDSGQDDLAAPRELVFVLDCSGSMSGAPIEAARDVVRRALEAARPGDTLQILRFSDRASGLWDYPMPASPSNIERARAYLDTLRGEGGTQMLDGIRAALDPQPDPRRLRLVAFLTDGYIGNETEVLDAVRRRLGDARLFAFGIGSSVNRYLLENLAHEGRGVAAFLGPREKPDAMVRRFVERIGTPVFTDLRLTWEGLDVDDQEPAAIPDLFAGQPLIVHGHYDRPGRGALVLEGTLRGRRVALRREVTFPEAAADHPALARLWARARIDRLTRESYGSPAPGMIEEIAALGLQFHLVTPFTSLVAVDPVVSNPGGGSGTLRVPVAMPEGVDFGGPVQALRSRGSMGFQAPPSPGPVAGLPGSVATGPSHRTEAPGTAKERDRSWSRPDAPRRLFLRLVVVEEDGTRRTIQDDGEAWLETTAGRRLVRVLAAEQMDELAATLAAAEVDTWPAGEATYARGRARLVLVTPGGMTRSLPLSPLPPRAAVLLALVRAATS